jgi:hypothetical protein
MLLSIMPCKGLSVVVCLPLEKAIFLSVLYDLEGENQYYVMKWLAFLKLAIEESCLWANAQ